MFATDTWIIERARVHRSTVARWRARREFPAALERLAEIELHGQLELIHTAWSGFTIDTRTGELILPGGERYRAGELLALPIRAQHARAMQRELDERRRPRRWWRTLARALSRALRREQHAKEHAEREPA